MSVEMLKNALRDFRTKQSESRYPEVTTNDNQGGNELCNESDNIADSIVIRPHLVSIQRLGDVS